MDAMESFKTKKRLRQAKFREKTSDSAKKVTRLKDTQSCKKQRGTMTHDQLEEERSKDTQSSRKQRCMMTQDQLEEERLKDTQSYKKQCDTVTQD